MEVFRSVSADGGPDQAVLANTRRRSVFPSAARAEIEAAASDLFRTWLLRPARHPVYRVQLGGVVFAVLYRPGLASRGWSLPLEPFGRCS